MDFTETLGGCDVDETLGLFPLVDVPEVAVEFGVVYELPTADRTLVRGWRRG